MHRDYQSNTPIRFYWFSDRIEIQSPGGLFGEVTPETLDRRNSYRNPVLAEAMKALGYVNRFGYGIQRAEVAMKRNGNPDIEFNIEANIVLAVLCRRPS
jgi:ATP-dependent DNA helicase RecG